MKDKVFIAWSGNSEVAHRVREILEENDYLGYVGGNEDNNSQGFSICEIVLKQMDECNQCIAIFQKREGNIVSSNLYFELGYALAKHSAQKVHLVKNKSDNLEIPSDLKSVIVQDIEVKKNPDEATNTDDVKSNGEQGQSTDKAEIESFAQGIVKYFLDRQKMSVDEDKMKLIDERSEIHKKIAHHYNHENGSLCSDYELAQYILFYMHAAHMFGDERKVEQEMIEFKRYHFSKFSLELGMAVDLCISFLKMILKIKLENGIIFIERDAYHEYMDVADVVVKQLGRKSKPGIFDEWATVFVTEQKAYVHMLFAANPDISEDRRERLYQSVIADAEESFVAMEKLKEQLKDTAKRERDDKGILSLFRAYLYRNLFTSYKFLGQTKEAFGALEKSKEERAGLKKEFANGAIDSKVYDNFLMEYYLTAAEYIDWVKEYGLNGKAVEGNDRDEIDDQLYKINKYLKRIKAQETERHNVYVKHIEEYYKKLSGN